MVNTTIGVWRTVGVLISTLFYLAYSKIINFSLQAHFLEIFCKSYLKKGQRWRGSGLGFFVLRNSLLATGCFFFNFCEFIHSALPGLVVLFYGLH